MELTGVTCNRKQAAYSSCGFVFCWKCFSLLTIAAVYRVILGWGYWDGHPEPSPCWGMVIVSRWFCILLVEKQCIKSTLKFLALSVSQGLLKIPTVCFPFKNMILNGSYNGRVGLRFPSTPTSRPHAYPDSLGPIEL